MEAEERPSKLRKVSHSSDSSEALFDKPLDLIDSRRSVATSTTRLVELKDEPGANSNDNQKPNLDTRNGEAVLLPEPRDEPNPTDLSENTTPPMPSITEEPPKLSKNQLKKLKRQQEWESQKELRKRTRKQKAKERKERKRERLQQEEPNATNSTPLLDRIHPVQVPITIIFDCGFDDLMRDNERKSLAAQLARSYSDNRKTAFRSHLAVASFGGKLKHRFDTVLSGHYKSWKGVRFFSEDFVYVSEQAKGWMRGQDDGQLAGALLKPNVAESKEQEAEVVYLTSEGEETLTELKPYSTYIIGGLVDHNREKGICYKRAKSKGVRTAKLAIGEFLKMDSRKVLAVNHVNEIMLRWLEVGDWGAAFMKVIPKRKGGALRGKSENIIKDAQVDETEEYGPADNVVAGSDEDLNAGLDQDIEADLAHL